MIQRKIIIVVLKFFLNGVKMVEIESDENEPYAPVLQLRYFLENEENDEEPQIVQFDLPFN